MLADSVGLALLVVLETLTPAERLAFVLHDLFAVPFDEIAPIVGTQPDGGPAARQPRPPPGPVGPGRRTGDADQCPRQREVVEAFLAAVARAATSRRCSRCSTPTWCCASTPPASGSARPRRCAAGTRWRGSSTAGRGPRGPRSSTARAGAVVLAGDRPRIVITFIVVDGAIIGMEASPTPT